MVIILVIPSGVAGYYIGQRPSVQAPAAPSPPNITYTNTYAYGTINGLTGQDYITFQTAGHEVSGAIIHNVTTSNGYVYDAYQYKVLLSTGTVYTVAIVDCSPTPDTITATGINMRQNFSCP